MCADTLQVGVVYHLTKNVGYFVHNVTGKKGLARPTGKYSK